MRSILLCSLVVASLLGSSAHADVVHLTSGGSIKGTVIQSEGTTVVVRTPEGRMEIPRRLVKRIERQAAGQTALELARERAGQGDLRGAEKLYERATQAANPATARAARQELVQLRARILRAKKAPPKKPRAIKAARRKPIAKQPTPVPSQALREAAQALRQGEAKRALRLLIPLKGTHRKDPTFHYLIGRAHELSGASRQAWSSYLQVLTLHHKQQNIPPVPVSNRATLPWLGELARRSFGEALVRGAPGVGQEWRRVEVERYSVYHRLRVTDPARDERVTVEQFAAQLKGAHGDVLRALGIRSEELGRGRVMVVLYANTYYYDEADGDDHALHIDAPDGTLHSIDTFPMRAIVSRRAKGRRNVTTIMDTLRHKVAHTVLRETFRLPGWTEEAAANFMHPRSVRERIQLVNLGRLELPPAIDFLRGKVQAQEGAMKFDAQGFLVFRALVELTGSPRKALELCQAMRLRGTDVALEGAKLDPARIQKTCDKLAWR